MPDVAAELCQACMRVAPHTTLGDDWTPGMVASLQGAALSAKLLPPTADGHAAVVIHGCNDAVGMGAVIFEEPAYPAGHLTLGMCIGAA